MAALENMGNGNYGWESPANNAAAVTPHNTNDLTYITRALYVGGAGNIVVIMHGGTQLTFTGVPAGSILPIRVSRVLSTDTTATSIVALW